MGSASSIKVVPRKSEKETTADSGVASSPTSHSEVGGILSNQPISGKHVEPILPTAAQLAALESFMEKSFADVEKSFADVKKSIADVQHSLKNVTTQQLDLTEHLATVERQQEDLVVAHKLWNKKNKDDGTKKVDNAVDERKDDDNEFKDYEIACLKAHNNFRSKHGVPDMTLNRELCDMAQNYAEYLLKNNLFKHSEDSSRRYDDDFVGENLGYFMEPGYKRYDATEAWYNEIKDYDYGTPGLKQAGVVGHFTQVVWKESALLGVGKALDLENGRTVMVGRYYPTGNIVGRFPENVTRPN